MGAVQILSLELPRSFIFPAVFSIRKTYFQEHLIVFLIHFFFCFFFFIYLFFDWLQCVKQEFTLFVCICFFKKSDALHFFQQADYF